LAEAQTNQDQTAPDQSQRRPDEGEEQPIPAPLALGSMAIASDPALKIDAMAVDVAIDRVSYAYSLKNLGTTSLALAASIAFPDLEVNNEGTIVYDLPSQNPENVVNMTVQANGRPVATTPLVAALALGVDRLAELKAANLPLIPFGEATARALEATKPDTLEKLQRLGVVTPRDASDPDAPVIADWSLHVVHSWTQVLAPKSNTNVVVSYAPIKAVYTIDAGSLSGFDALKEQVCLTPQAISAAKALLSQKGAMLDVADITLANDGPARWLDNPPASVAVRKPAADAIIVFCGIDAATQAQDVVKGTMPPSSEAPGLRILIFSRSRLH
jgi:hypothetical protein